MLTINLEWDANALAAPQSFRDAVQAAANVLEAAIDDPITVNVAVGYGEYDLGGPQYQTLSQYSLGGINSSVAISYPLLRAALAADASSASDEEGVQSLPDTATLDGQSEFFISGAEAKALGALPANSTEIDGEIGFPTSFGGDGLVAAAIVELVHALGLLNGGGGPLSLVEYTAPGVHLLDSNDATATSAYFSIDGGNTNLATYDIGFDETLFSNQSNDPLSIPNTGATVLTSLDLTELGSIGFDTNSTPTLPTPSITPTQTAAGTADSVTVQNISVGENTAISALALIKSVSEPTGDIIAGYTFYDQGSGNGHFEIAGVAEPDGQWIDVLDTQLGEFDYIGGSAPGSEFLDIAALDFTTGDYSPTAQLRATTTSAQPPAGELTADGQSDALMTNTGGALVLDEISGGQEGYTQIGALGPEWDFEGDGAIAGDGKDQFLLWYGTNDSPTYGSIVLGEDDGGTASYTKIGSIGPEWQFEGVGPLAGGNASDVLLWYGTDDSPTYGALVVGADSNGSLSYTDIGALGPEWKFEGVGGYLNNGSTDFLIWDTSASSPIDGSLVVGQDVGGSAQYTLIGGLGPSTWQFEGSGDLLGDGKESFLLWDGNGSDPNYGALVVGEINGGAVGYTRVGAVGPQWQFLGVGDYDGASPAEFLMRNSSTGALVLGTIANGAASYAQVGAVGPTAWNFHATNVATLT